MTTMHPQARRPDRRGATPSHTGRPVELDAARRVALQVAPAAILGSMYLVFLAVSQLVPIQYAVFAGLPVYWLVWCLAFPLWVVGWRGLRKMFRPSPQPLGRPAAVGLACLLLPIVIAVPYAAITVLDGGIARIPPAAVAIAAAIALCNGVGEEVLWRGTYHVAHRGALIAGYVYPAIGFGVWHLAAMPFAATTLPGGHGAYVAGAIALGLMWGWVTRRSGSIRGPVASHVTLNFLSQVLVWVVLLA